jgi:hypothetical protein
VSGGKKVDRYHVGGGKQGPDIRVADDRDIPCYPANGNSPQMSNKAWNHKSQPDKTSTQPRLEVGIKQE